jgi:hypothetical protein
MRNEESAMNQDTHLFSVRRPREVTVSGTFLVRVIELTTNTDAGWHKHKCFSYPDAGERDETVELWQQPPKCVCARSWTFNVGRPPLPHAKSTQPACLSAVLRRQPFGRSSNVRASRLYLHVPIRLAECAKIVCAHECVYTSQYACNAWREQLAATE